MRPGRRASSTTERGATCEGTIYGRRRQAQLALYEAVTASASDLRGQLEALVQAAHTSTRPEDVEAVRAAVWAAHQRRDRD